MERIRLSPREQLGLLAPYAFHHLKEQFLVVVPVCLYIVLFQVAILRAPLLQGLLVSAGIACVFIGLAFFLEGIRIGLVPIGEIVGNSLPKKGSKLLVVLFAFLLGILASIGEPVLGTLQLAGAHLDPAQAPLLHFLLVGQPFYLIATVSLGVGIAALLGVLRFLHGWSLKPIVLPLVLLAIGLTLLASRDHELASAIGLAWDTGAVIVGPVLCPLILALGVGVCRATGKTDPSLAGFGMVGLISVVPIAAVVLLTFGLHAFGVGAKPADGAAVSHVSPHAPAATSASLPQTLDYEVFAPRIARLALPRMIDDPSLLAKISNLPSGPKSVLFEAYRPKGTGASLVLAPRPSPRAWQEVPGILSTLAGRPLDAERTTLLQAYRITPPGEKAEGRIELRTDRPAGADGKVLALLKELGHVPLAPLFLESVTLAFRAILPIFAFLFLVMLLLRQRGPPGGQIVLSLGYAVLGLTLFFSGLSFGLGHLGVQIGDRLPAAFLDHLPLFPGETSLFPDPWGKIVVVVFAVLLGYGATLAEPAFNVLGQQVEDVTEGAFKKSLFSQTVALGVGIGAGLGIYSLLYDVPLLHLLIPPYALLAVLTLLNKEMFVNIAWDGGAVTTGPVTVPLKLAIGLSLSAATGAGEGFGVLALASAYPVLLILLLGLVFGSRKRVATP